MAEKLEDKKPLALEAYDSLAASYAARVDTKPHNAYYERPATLSLLPDPAGKRVLDAGCGPGVYTEWLVDRGAEVLGIDASPNMIELAEKRLAGRAAFRNADLGMPLDFLNDASFDIVISPLVMDYVEDWRAAFAEFHRVLRPGGCFVFSIGHPFFDFLYFKTENYFATERVGGVWKGFGEEPIYMPTTRRPLEEALNPLCETGFRIDRILEPKVTEDLRNSDPRHYEELSKRPGFLCIRALKDQAATV